MALSTPFLVCNACPVGTLSAVACSLAPFETELGKLFNVRLNQMANPYESPDVEAATDARPLPRLRLAFLFASTLLLVASIVWCIATLHSPQRFIFLPGGDVGLGFRSYAGWLQLGHQQHGLRAVVGSVGCCHCSNLVSRHLAVSLPATWLVRVDDLLTKTIRMKCLSRIKPLHFAAMAAHFHWRIKAMSNNRIEPDADPEWERELQQRAQYRRRGCFEIAMIVILYSGSVGSAYWFFSTSGLCAANVESVVLLRSIQTTTHLRFRPKGPSVPIA